MGWNQIWDTRFWARNTSISRYDAVVGVPTTAAKTHLQQFRQFKSHQLGQESVEKSWEFTAASNCPNVFWKTLSKSYGIKESWCIAGKVILTWVRTGQPMVQGNNFIKDSTRSFCFAMPAESQQTLGTSCATLHDGIAHLDLFSEEQDLVKQLQANGH